MRRRSPALVSLAALAVVSFSCAAPTGDGGDPTATATAAATALNSATPSAAPTATGPEFATMEAPTGCLLEPSDVPSEYDEFGEIDDGTQPDEWLQGHLARLGPTPTPAVLAEREAELAEREFLGGWWCHFTTDDPATSPPSIYSQVSVFAGPEGAEAEMSDVVDGLSCETLEELTPPERIADAARAFECTARLADDRQRTLIQVFFVAANAFHYVAVSALTDSPDRPELADALPVVDAQLEFQRGE